MIDAMHDLLADLDSVRTQLHRGVFVTAADKAWRDELARQDEKLSFRLHELIAESLGLKEAA